MSINAFATTSFGAQAGLLLDHLDHIRFVGPVIYLRVPGDREPLLMTDLKARFPNLMYETVTGDSKQEAMKTLSMLYPELSIWITGLRRTQSAERAVMEPLARQYGIMKVNPFLDWPDEKVIEYLEANDIPHSALPGPKVECGLHTS